MSLFAVEDQEKSWSYTPQRTEFLLKLLLFPEGLPWLVVFVCKKIKSQVYLKSVG